MELDDNICYCFHVTKRKIVNFIRIHRPRRASQISECGGAGTGCGWCIPFMKRCFVSEREGRTTELDAITPNEYARLRGQYIRDGHGLPAAGAVPPPEPDSTSYLSDSEST